ncbi:unnamed protein product [Nesidiocoris tenuis]|uniref:Uncharacterized protein n=1 Tax=Nesidiocoris tenuis TaxID=355587 RepID=A0A6H5HBH1_9HEMI|nr:unnamed protein product [Nesidiocoris tenuis]
MVAPRDFGSSHFLITDGANIVQIRQLSLARFGETFDLVDGRSALHEHQPADPSFAPANKGFELFIPVITSRLCVKERNDMFLKAVPNIEVCVDAHHARTNGTTRFKNQYPGTVEEQEDSEAEFDLQ